MSYGAFSRTPSAPRLKARRVWDPDLCPPHMVTAWNDEFERQADQVNPGRWTGLNWSGLTSVDQSKTIPGMLMVSNPTTASVSTYLLRSILQPFPPGDFTAICKLRVSLNAINNTRAGLVLATATSGGTQLSNEVVYTSTPASWQIIGNKWTGSNTFSGTLVTAKDLMAFPAAWLRIRRVGTTSYLGYSMDGITYVEVAVTDATLAVTPAYIGLMVNNSTASGSPDQVVAIEYFRLYESATAAWGGYRTVREF